MYQCVPLCCDVLSCGGEYSVVVCSVIHLESVMFKGDCMGLHQVSQGSDTCMFVFHKTFHKTFRQFIHFSIRLAH